jgi:AbrB family looped-hinge helix DNA binding protein
MKELQHDVQLLGIATLGPKGQVVIPAEAREKMGIEPGDKLVSVYVKDKNIVCFMTMSQVQVMVDRIGAKLDGLRDALKNS